MMVFAYLNYQSIHYAIVVGNEDLSQHKATWNYVFLVPREVTKGADQN